MAKNLQQLLQNLEFYLTLTVRYIVQTAVISLILEKVVKALPCNPLAEVEEKREDCM